MVGGSLTPTYSPLYHQFHNGSKGSVWQEVCSFTFQPAGCGGGGLYGGAKWSAWFQKEALLHPPGSRPARLMHLSEEPRAATTKTPCAASWECLVNRGDPQRRCNVSHLPVLVEQAQQLVSDAKNIPPVEAGHSGVPPLLWAGVQEVENVTGGEVGVRQAVVHEVSDCRVPQGVLQ